MKMYLTKYALTYGIAEVEVTPTSLVNSYFYKKPKKGYLESGKLDINLFEKLDDAVKDSERLRLHEIKLTENKLNKLKTMQIKIKKST